MDDTGKNENSGMECWIFVFNPLERYMANYRQIFDAWEAGGVRGIVVGRMYFMQEDAAQSRPSRRTGRPTPRSGWTLPKRLPATRRRSGP